MTYIDYGKILKRSWEITKKYKWLWVYGLLLAASGGSSGGGGGGRSPSPLKDLPKELPKEIPKDLPEKTSYVLGQTTTILNDWFTSIPVSTWILIGLLIISSIIIWSVFAWIMHSWAQAGLIGGVEDANQNRDVTLISTSKKAIPKIKAMIIYGLLSFGICLATILGPLLIVGLGFLFLSLFPIVSYIWLAISGIAAVLFIVIALFLFTLTTIYAERLIVLHNYAPWPAWKKGFSLGKKEFLPTLVMGIIHQAIGCGVGCLSLLVLLIIIGVPGLIILIPSFVNGFHFPSIPAIIALLMFVLLGFSTAHLVNAVFMVFKYSNWNLFMKEILSKEGKRS